MSNRLANETSPYLLQHAENPVDWYPWCDEALARAKSEQRPIFLSVGYSACHWCHVMEHESFEDEATAKILNEHFICIKVDREERPDIDQIYMTAVQIMTGRGGWPMSVFLTPELHPFFGGTYWPPTQRMGMPGFDQVLAAVMDAWQNRKDQAIEQAEAMTAKIAASGIPAAADFKLQEEVLTQAAAQLANSFDATYGGFGGAPKFPHSMDLQLLLRVWQRTNQRELQAIVQTSLDRMAHGGIYDHVGGGFARYSTDAMWLVPHFEKMLYDNALLVNAYLDSYLINGDPWHARVARETLDYVRHDMTGKDGGFFSAEDADSEGVEGKFYVWSRAEIDEVLGAESEDFCRVFGVTDRGNFEGKNILHLARPLAQIASDNDTPLEPLVQSLDASLAKLKSSRAGRIAPGKDDKVIVSWNGLMLDSFARAARVLESDDYSEVATRTAAFIRQHLWNGSELFHSWRRGRVSQSGFLDDYSALANGLVSLYEASFDEQWLDWAFDLMEVVKERFVDSEGGALFYTPNNGEQLITRPKDLQDSSIPSGNALAATALIRLASIGDRADLRDLATQIMSAASGLLQEAPAAAGQMLLGLDRALGPSIEVVIVGDKEADATRALLSEVSRRFLPRASVVCCAPDEQRANSHAAPLLAERPMIADSPTAYLCVGQACEAPMQTPAALGAALDRLALP